MLWLFRDFQAYRRQCQYSHMHSLLLVCLLVPLQFLNNVRSNEWQFWNLRDAHVFCQEDDTCILRRPCPQVLWQFLLYTVTDTVVRRLWNRHCCDGCCQDSRRKYSWCPCKFLGKRHRFSIKSNIAFFKRVIVAFYSQNIQPQGVLLISLFVLCVETPNFYNWQILVFESGAIFN